MATKETSQTQQKTGPANAHFDRVSGWMEEWDKASQKSAERVESAIDESAKLMKASVGASFRLMEDWRRITFDASRQAFDAISAPFAS